MKIRERKAGGSCPLCREALAGSPEERECPGCSTGYHSSCLEELGGCSTLGCGERVERPRAAEIQVRAAAPAEGVQVTVDELRGIRPRQREEEEPEREPRGLQVVVGIFQGLMGVGLVAAGAQSLEKLPALGMVLSLGGLLLLGLSAKSISVWFDG